MGDFESWNNQPPRTPHAAPNEVLRAYQRQERRREIVRRAILTMAYVIAFLAAAWAILHLGMGGLKMDSKNCSRCAAIFRPTEAELQEAMRRKIDEIDEAARVNTENVKKWMREREAA